MPTTAVELMLLERSRDALRDKVAAVGRVRARALQLMAKNAESEEDFDKADIAYCDARSALIQAELAICRAEKELESPPNQSTIPKSA